MIAGDLEEGNTNIDEIQDKYNLDTDSVTESEMELSPEPDNSIGSSFKFKNNTKIMNESSLDKLLRQFEDIKDTMESRQNNIINKISKEDNIFVNKLILNLNKNTLTNHFDNRLSKLYQKIRILEKKYATYKTCYDYVNIGIILTSTLLTIVETIKVEFKESFGTTCQQILNLTPIFFSSIITCSASIIKFKKYQDNMENISKLIDKATFCIRQIKKAREHICFCDTQEQYDGILKKYNNEIFDNYSSCFQNMERIIKNSDYDKYLEKIFYTDYKVHKLEKERKCFFEKYNTVSCDKVIIDVATPKKSISLGCINKK